MFSLFLHLLWVVPVCYVLFKVLHVVFTPYLPSPLLKIPGPGNTSWLNGNTKEIMKGQALEPHMSWIHKFKDAPLIHYRMYGNSERVLFVDPDSVMLALNEKGLFSKNLLNYRSLSSFIGNGLVTLLGSQHTEHRRMIQPAFHFQNLKGMVQTFASQTEKLCKIWRTKEQGSEIDVTSDFSKLTLNIIGLTAFGFDFDSFGEEDSIGKQATTRFTNLIAGGNSNIANMLVFFFPPLVNLPIGLFRNVKDDINYTNDLVRALIKEKRLHAANQEDSIDQHNNLLDILLASQDTKSMTDQQLADHVKTLMFAGHETTATLTTWCIYALSREPEIVSKLKEELDEKVSDPSAITYESLESLKYLKAVIKETLRMYPPVGLVARRLEKDFHYKGYTVPAGTTCTISPYVLHHNSQLWDKPEVFNPDRWLTDEKRHRFQFLPFLKGPRNCIGEKFAMLEATAILAIVLREFRFEMDKELWENTQRTLRVTMRPKPALRVTLSKFKN
mmetsp:Transcript_8429/g.10425  ORF Transcript_8429/g.10425 Transcript_8429/m.10425 type:complete len:501 (-) Transcript_8429:41-1543(-)